jgi:hypothetical protein
MTALSTCERSEQMIALSTCERSEQADRAVIFVTRCLQSTFVGVLIVLLNDDCFVLFLQVEIKLKKLEGIRWEKLEGDPAMPNVKQIPSLFII